MTFTVLTLLPALLLVLLGSFFLRRAGRIGAEARAFARSARVTRAEVLDVVEKQPNRYLMTESVPGQAGAVAADSTSFFPVVGFTGPDGTPVRTELMWGARPAPAKVGDVVEIRYDPADPTRAAMTRGLATGGASSVILRIMAVFMILFGIVLAVFWALLKLVLHVPF